MIANNNEFSNWNKFLTFYWAVFFFSFSWEYRVPSFSSFPSCFVIADHAHLLCGRRIDRWGHFSAIWAWQKLAHWNKHIFPAAVAAAAAATATADHCHRCFRSDPSIHELLTPASTKKKRTFLPSFHSLPIKRKHLTELVEKSFT